MYQNQKIMATTQLKLLTKLGCLHADSLFYRKKNDISSLEKRNRNKHIISNLTTQGEKCSLIT